MFDFFARWPDDFDRPNRHRVDPPRPVVVDLGAILPPNTAPSRGLPMRVTQAGLKLIGDQTALVRMEVPAAGGHHGVLPMLQWIPAGAVSPLSGPGVPPPAGT
jgi:hypothetical protein